MDPEFPEFLAVVPEIDKGGHQRRHGGDDEADRVGVHHGVQRRHHALPGLYHPEEFRKTADQRAYQPGNLKGRQPARNGGQRRYHRVLVVQHKIDRLRHCLGDFGEDGQHRFGQLRHALFIAGVGLVVLHQRRVVFLPGLPGGGQPLFGQFLQYQIGPLCRAVCGKQFFVECVLAGSRPVEHVGKGSRHLAGLHRLIDGLGQGVDRDAVPVGCPRAYRPMYQQPKLLLGQPERLEVGGGGGRRLAVPQHPIEGVVGRFCFLRRIPRLLAGHLEAAHDLHVFLGAFRRVPEAGGQPLGALHDGAGLQVIPEAGSLLPGVLQSALRLFGGLCYLLDRLFVDAPDGVFRLERLAAQVPQLGLGFDDLPLEGVVLLPADVPPLKLRLHLLFRVLQGFQLAVGLLHFLAQQLILLPQKLGVAGIQLEQPLDVPQLPLGVPDVLVDAGEGFRQPGGVAAYLNGDALDPIRQAVRLLRKIPAWCRAAPSNRTFPRRWPFR